MARPSPTILCTYEGPTQSIDILKTSAIWGVTHLGELVSMRYRQHNITGQMAKYPKTLFPSRASALNCARRLNTVFNTNAFSISIVVCDHTEYVEPPLPDLNDFESVEPN